MTISQSRYLAIVVFSAIILMACRGVNDSGSGATGELTLGITDGPVDRAFEVVLYVSAVEIIPAQGDAILVEDLRKNSIELLKLTGGEREQLLLNFDLPDGSYQSARLVIDQTRSYIRLNEGQFDLIVPAGEQANLTIALKAFFDPDNDFEDFTIDIDLRRSIRRFDDGGVIRYELHPRMRIAETGRAEILRGTVSENLIIEPRCSNENNNNDGNAVYLYRGSSVNVQDIRDNSFDPFATATVEYNSQSNNWEFAFGFIPRESYTAVFTCDALIDDPEQDDSLQMEFSNAINVDVQQGMTETITF